MQFLTLFLISVCSVHQIFSYSDGKLTRFKKDFHKIGHEVENFVFDIAKEVFQNTDKFLNVDYDEDYSEETDQSKNNNAINKETSQSDEIDTDNNDNEYSRRKKRGIDTFQGKPYMPMANFVGSEYSPMENLAGEQMPMNYIGADNFVGAEPTTIKGNFPIFSKEEQAEKSIKDKHLDDIKDELKRLFDLVAILKDQQNILAMLDKDGEGTSKVPAQQYIKDLLSVLENPNNNDIEGKESKTKALDSLPIQEENGVVDKMISDNINPVQPVEEKLLGSPITDLEIKTEKEMLGAPFFLPINLPQLGEHKRNKENKTPGIDTNNMNESKFSIQKDKSKEKDAAGLVKDFPKKYEVTESNIANPNIKGVVKLNEHKDLNQPNPHIQGKSNNSAFNLKENELDSKLPEVTIESTAAKNNALTEANTKIMEARLNDENAPDFMKTSANPNMKTRSSVISELLDELTDKSSKHVLASELRELENKLNLQSRQEILMKEISILQKLLEQQMAASRELPNEEDDFVKKLHILLNLADTASKPQGKSDTDVEDELKKLQRAIKALRPSQEMNLLDFPSSKALSGDKSSTVTLTIEQVIELRKKLDDIINMQIEKDKHIPNLDSIKDSQMDTSRYIGPYTPASVRSQTDHPYYPNYFNPFFYPPMPYAPQEPFIDNFKPFENDFGTNFGPIPYMMSPPIKPLSHPQDNLDLEVKNQFFQPPQQILQDRSLKEINHNKEEFARYSLQKPGYNPSKDNNNEDLKLKSIQELKTELNSLENILRTMSSSSYNQKYEDQTTLTQLTKEINRLKEVINSMIAGSSVSKLPAIPNIPPETSNTRNHQTNIHPANTENQQPSHKRFRRSVENVENVKNVENNKKPSDQELSSDMKLYDDVTTKLREYLQEQEQKATTSHDTNENARNVDLLDIRERINNLKYHIEHWPQDAFVGFPSLTRDNGYYKPLEYLQKDIYKKPTYDYYKKPFDPNNLLVPPKKVDIFSDILLKILDKIIELLPKILEKLFGAGLEGLLDKVKSDKYYGYNDKTSLDYNDKTSLVSVFYNLGIFGYIPLIILKIVNAISTCVSILKQNKFLKNFLVPAFVLLIVAGAVIFLTWWLKEDDDQNKTRQIDFVNHRFRNADSEYYNYKNGYPVSYQNSPRYTGTNFFNSYQNIPYPINAQENYLYYNKNYPYLNSREYFNRNNNLKNIQPSYYYRTYFDEASRKKIE